MNDRIRSNFPTINKYVYLDSAALVLKPQQAIDAVINYYENISVSVRTKDTPLGFEVKQKIDETKQAIATLVDCTREEVIFTSGTTESLNMISYMFDKIVEEGDEILIDEYNHSSNMINWIELSKRTKAKIVITDDVTKKINKKTKIVALAQENNTFSKVYDWNKLRALTNKHNAILVNDAAQAISHEKVSLNQSDVIAFSANKFYGPTGLGVLIVRKSLLEILKPAKFGGGIVKKISKKGDWEPYNILEIHEAGTPNLAGIYMFNQAIKFFNEIGYNKTQSILKDLSFYAHKRLQSVKNIEIYSKPGDIIILFNIKSVFCQDVSYYLAHKNIYTRGGFFCAHYIPNIKNQAGFVRASLGIYNNYHDIDLLVDALNTAKNYVNL